MNHGEKKAAKEKIACIIHGVEYVISSHNEALRVADKNKKEDVLVLESTIDYLTAYKKLLFVRYGNVGNKKLLFVRYGNVGKE
jgi:hypothetical protein